MKKIVVLCLALLLLLGAGYRQWTATQEELHEAADVLRANGYSEDSPAIKALQAAWHAEEPYMVRHDTEPVGEAAAPWETYNANHNSNQTFKDFATCCNTVWKEGGYAGDEAWYTLACEVLNRVESDVFPNTVVDVVTQKRQYSPSYVRNDLEGIPDELVETVSRAWEETVRTVDVRIQYHTSPPAWHSGLTHAFALDGVTWGGYRWRLDFFYE